MRLKICITVQGKKKRSPFFDDIVFTCSPIALCMTSPLQQKCMTYGYHGRGFWISAMPSIPESTALLSNANSKSSPLYTRVLAQQRQALAGRLRPWTPPESVCGCRVCFNQIKGTVLWRTCSSIQNKHCSTFSQLNRVHGSLSRFTRTITLGVRADIPECSTAKYLSWGDITGQTATKTSGKRSVCFHQTQSSLNYVFTLLLWYCLIEMNRKGLHELT